ncbi:MAG: YhdP family protein [Halioglobus sp.]
MSSRISLENAFYYRLSSILWKTMVAAIVVLAIYVSFGKLLMSNIGQFGEPIVAQLNARSPFLIEADKVSGEWHSFTPEIVLSGLRLSNPDGSEAPFQLARGRVAIDVLQSLQTLSLRSFRVSLDGLKLRAVLSPEGRLSIAGMGGDGGFSEPLQAFLLDIEQLRLANNQIELQLPDGASQHFDLNLKFWRNGSLRHIDSDLVARSTGTKISVQAKGLGNPQLTEEFSGELYLQLSNSKLESLQQLVPQLSGVTASGNVALQAWLGWNRGEPSLEASLTGSDILLAKADDSFRVPLKYFTTDLNLTRVNDRWRLFASDLELQSNGNPIRLPRLQMDIRGDSARLRAERVALNPINKLLLGLDATSEVLREVFTTLNVKGELSTLELNVADYQAPASDWELTGEFSDLEVDSWRGAPAVHAERGYLQFSQEGGAVLIDSHQFSMAYPTVYQEPLRYDDFYGTVFVDWNSTDVVLTSSLVIAQGVEGKATALFGLNIPLQKNDIGLEMDLLVGLEKTHPIHRTKYLPYTLNSSLLNWLKSSIGDGRIEQGGFLWRGSLRKNAAANRTVQMFFNVADTSLNYYPGWPPLSGVEGMVLIDGTEVSVWSEKASLYGSSIEFISAEAWKSDNNQMMLAISAQMKGNAADGLKTINESPLVGIVGNAFDDWQLDGELATQLELLLNLGDPAVAPMVEVDTQWQGVDVLIEPGRLALDNVTGTLRYSSATGFTSERLSGELWGKPLSAQVWQQLPDSGAYDPGQSMTQIQLSSRVAMEDVRHWLDLDLLSLASGEGSATVSIDVPPGQSPRLKISSDMQGVGLDLPEPWLKKPDSVGRFTLEMPLAGESRVIEMSLDDELYLQLQLSGRQFGGLALGIAQPPQHLIPGTVYVSGHAPLVNEAQWQRFLEQYVYGSFTESDESALAGNEVEATAAALPLSVRIDALRADTLLLYGQGMADVVFSLESDGGPILIFAETDWLQGELELFNDGQPSQLRLSQLELSGLGQLDLQPIGDTQTELELPALDVSLASITYEREPLGELKFSLRTEGGTLQADKIIGRFAGLTISAEQPAALVWESNQTSNRTTLSAHMQFDNLGETLDQLAYQKMIETSTGEFDLALEWPGGPQDIALDSVTGSLKIQMKDGSFLETPSGASGTLRVVGILNLADIVERLSLDLSDMFASGIPFHSVDGEVFFHGGSIEVAKMDVEGRSSGFQFTGVSDVSSRTLDGELIATLPVANNLPWVAALAVGLPVAAGVFVVSKVFEEQMKRFSSAVYTISGSWEDPQVDFDRIFDISSERKVIRPAVDGGADLVKETNETVEAIIGLEVSASDTAEELSGEVDATSAAIDSEAADAQSAQPSAPQSPAP